MGPHRANIFNQRAWRDITQEITLEVMRVVLAIGLFAIGVELPQSYLAHYIKGLLTMVVPIMSFGRLVVATKCHLLCCSSSVLTHCRIAVIYGLFEPLNYTSALAVAAWLTPTDPFISSAIVGTMQSCLLSS
jgi:sodium/hydrogen antiporter